MHKEIHYCVFLVVVKKMGSNLTVQQLGNGHVNITCQLVNIMDPLELILCKFQL